jgi:hypothetical protein
MLTIYEMLRESLFSASSLVDITSDLRCPNIYRCTESKYVKVTEEFNKIDTRYDKVPGDGHLQGLDN